MGRWIASRNINQRSCRNAECRIFKAYQDLCSICIQTSIRIIDKLYRTCSGVCPGQSLTDSQNIQPINQSELRHFLGKLLIGQIISRAA